MEGMHKANEESAIPVFISYSWDNQVHEDLVFDFVNHLRAEGGFNAQMDKGLSQKETATNFVKMMCQFFESSTKFLSNQIAECF